MIDEMSSALAAESTGAAASLVAQAIGGTSVKVQLQEPAGREPYISMGLTMDRAWATVAHALNVGAYRLHQEDADIGLFYVTYDEDRELADDEEEGGWFSWGGKGEDELAKAAEGDPAAGAGQYRPEQRCRTGTLCQHPGARRRAGYPIYP
ncbi:hypothetical protein [Microbulbifer taiwanensis]|uniref:hypothetical protein n=1 Tax=Microbulbifer taiwanensis TaxID=986746 RepID=UPI00361FA499